MRAPRVVVAGSANMDLVATAPVLPRPGETVLGKDFAMVPGGKGANQAIAAARAGASCAFLGAIGSDSFGVTLRARLAASGVDSAQARVVYGASGVALVVVDGEGKTPSSPRRVPTPRSRRSPRRSSRRCAGRTCSWPSWRSRSRR
ncbi:hypothetical protein Phou_024810 [Phytohabitans houttuyneae]|uniref:Carbohydrate kinase PfkB domain-containing protein n=1 Tax=Phytohabitans houttuyneae TaxID=1076126 RepID=A0A6V8K7A5_9ACTN|nr:hypothetical protein Phou_024810 [Phytohabitans houttuyneae]